jgi:hypothetical protein
MREIGKRNEETSYVYTIFIGGPRGKKLIGVGRSTAILKYVNGLWQYELE